MPTHRNWFLDGLTFMGKNTMKGKREGLGMCFLFFFETFIDSLWISHHSSPHPCSSKSTLSALASHTPFNKMKFKKTPSVEAVVSHSDSHTVYLLLLFLFYCLGFLGVCHPVPKFFLINA